MAPDERDIEAAALKLDLPSRARLAAKLLASVDTPSESEVDRLWIEEAQRRDDEMDARVESGRCADDVLKEARQRFG